jgi:hypothetical protein
MRPARRHSNRRGLMPRRGHGREPNQNLTDAKFVGNFADGGFVGPDRTLTEIDDFYGSGGISA